MWGILITDEDFELLNDSYAHQERSTQHDLGINYTEFIAMMTKCTTYQPGEGEVQTGGIGFQLKKQILDGCTTMKEAFKIFDRDSSGSVDTTEMRNVLSNFGVTYSDGDLDQLFRTYDKNGDGRFSYGEFVTLLQTLDKK